jgi:beta-aspartyl-peptidase (threonine type)
MKYALLMFLGLTVAELQAQKSEPSATNDFVLVIHGGAGTISKKSMSAEKEAAYRNTLQQALETGYKILNNGGTSLDAVEQVVSLLEDSPLFNAGKGAVYNTLGQQEMDASIMDGKTQNAGAVAGVGTIKNPISAARLVMDSSDHVMLTGKGAEQFAFDNELELVDSTYFYSERRLKQLERAKAKEVIQLDHDGEQGMLEEEPLFENHKKYGTVGAVALDKYGNMAAATSTGGLTNKKYGRVGDSPIVGAGTYADNNTCAISCTGHGEYFIRNVAAYNVSAMMEYGNAPLESAANRVLLEKIGPMGGKGGIIGVDKNGNIVMTFNTKGMYRGFIRQNGKAQVSIYKNEGHERK